MTDQAEVHPGPLPAEIYDSHFLPALFRQWGVVVNDLAGVAA
jgi:hypothetical protein